MKVFRLYAPSLEELRLVEEPKPSPGPGEVLVRLRAASLNFKDLLFVKSPEEGGIALGKPTIPVSDGAGEIVEVGSGVGAWAVGDRVTSVVVQKWFEGPIPADAMARALGCGEEGVLSQYRVFSEDALVRLPEGCSFEEGATLPIAALSAWNGVQHARPGETVLILGTGGVALFGLQFAKALGARTIITSSSDEKLDRARALGADETINYRTHENWHEIVLKMTEGRGADHVVETVSGSNLTQSVAATAIGGHVYLVGLQDRGLMDPYQIQFRAVNVHGIRMGSKTMLESMMEAVERHKITPVIDHVFRFEETVDAYNYLKKAGHFGKIVISID
nr:NAD(P)-dependent alcohol dehydrogenase [Sphingomonas sp. CDS-1]